MSATSTNKPKYSAETFGNYSTKKLFESRGAVLKKSFDNQNRSEIFKRLVPTMNSMTDCPSVSVNVLTHSLISSDKNIKHAEQKVQLFIDEETQAFNVYKASLDGRFEDTKTYGMSGDLALLKNDLQRQQKAFQKELKKMSVWEPMSESKHNAYLIKKQLLNKITVDLKNKIKALNPLQGARHIEENCSLIELDVTEGYAKKNNDLQALRSKLEAQKTILFNTCTGDPTNITELDKKKQQQLHVIGCQIKAIDSHLERSTKNKEKSILDEKIKFLGKNYAVAKQNHAPKEYVNYLKAYSKVLLAEYGVLLQKNNEQEELKEAEEIKEGIEALGDGTKLSKKHKKYFESRSTKAKEGIKKAEEALLKAQKKLATAQKVIGVPEQEIVRF